MEKNKSSLKLHFHSSCVIMNLPDDLAKVKQANKSDVHKNGTSEAQSFHMKYQWYANDI